MKKLFRHSMRQRLRDICKLAFAGLLGFLLGMSTELRHCPPCSAPSCQPPSSGAEDMLLADAYAHGRLMEPYKATNRFDVLRYDYFNMTDIFNNFDDSPRMGIRTLGHQMQGLRGTYKQAMALINSGRQSPLLLKQVLNGYHRLDPVRGEEFTLDAVFFPSRGGPTEDHRIHLVKPFAPLELVSIGPILNDQMVYFVLTMSRVNDRFYRFLYNYKEVCLDTYQHTYLLIVLFAGNDSPSDVQMAENVNTAVQALLDEYKHAHIRITKIDREFSRAVGLDIGAKMLPQDALLFFCDVDIIFTKDFLTRCRLNAIEGKQVFYPIVFAQYDPKIVKNYSPPETVENLNFINKYTGHWVTYGFGMVCLYNIDYRVVGGFDKEIEGWGGEDVNLYTKHVKSDLKVMRAADPDLIHVYHEKVCDPHLSVPQLKMCRNAAGEGLGSRQQLGKFIAANDKEDL